MANGKPRPAFYLAVFAIVIGLVALAMWRFGALPGLKPGTISKDELAKQAGGIEAPDTQGVTTAKQYTYVPAQKLPPVQGISS